MTTPDPALTSLLGQWKAAIQAATPGPWKASSYGPGALLSPTEADGEFIALAREAMPRLLEAVDRVLAHHPQMITVDGIVCATCSRRYPPTLWPCQELTDIRDALSAQTPAEGSEDA